MPDWVDSLRDARARLQPRWSDARRRAIAEGIARRRVRQGQARAAGLACALLVLVLSGAVWRARARSGALAAAPREAPVAPAAPAAPAAPETSALRLSDGSSALPLDARSTVEVAESSPGRVVLRVPRGGARFQVPHDSARVFRVEVGPVVVEDLGTAFTVERVVADAAAQAPPKPEEERVRVSVERGRVRVSWPDGAAELSAGEDGVFPDARTSPAPTASPAASHQQAPEEPRWRHLANSGDFTHAYDALQQQGVTVKDDVADLLLAADVARRSHHPADAVAPLRKVVSGHRADQRASLAGFTLGRVLLDDLGQPAEAAEAFSQARALAPDGPLAGDALAREVEARSRAGQSDRAKTLAEQYVRRYPDGSRIRSVRRFGDLE